LIRGDPDSLLRRGKHLRDDTGRRRQDDGTEPTEVANLMSGTRIGIVAALGASMVMRSAGLPDLIGRGRGCGKVKGGKERLVDEESQQREQRRDATPSTVPAVIAAASLHARSERSSVVRPRDKSRPS
jgi:hypothetical protein